MSVARAEGLENRKLSTREQELLYFVLYIVQKTMTSKFEKKIYDSLSKEPTTPSELASRLKINYKTVQRVLLQLALSNKDVHYKNCGRIQLFWRATRPASKGRKLT